MSTKYDILVGETSTPKIRVPKTGEHTYHAPVTLNDATGNEVAFEISYTVNKATSGNDTGLLVNMTDTASPGTSYLIDAQVGGTSKFSVSNEGLVTANKITAGSGLAYDTTEGLWFGDGDTGVYEASDDNLALDVAGVRNLNFRQFQIDGNSAYGPQINLSGATATFPTWAFVSDDNTGIGRADADQLSLVAGGVEGMRLTEAGSFVQNTMSGGTNTDTSGTINALAITPTYNQTSGTAANTDLLINRTETAVGSGDQYLIDAQVGGASKFGVRRDGAVGIGGAPFATNIPTISYNASFPGNLQFYDGATPVFTLVGDSSGGGGLHLDDQGFIKWGDADNNLTMTTDTGLVRDSAGVVRVTDGSTGDGAIKASQIRSPADPDQYINMASIGYFSFIDNGGTETARYGTRLEVAPFYEINWSSISNPGGTKDTGLSRDSAGVVKVTDGSTGNGSLKAKDLECAEAYTVAGLPAGAVGQIARITDGDAALAWGATAVNSGAGATAYLVWYNGTNWTVMGK